MKLSTILLLAFASSSSGSRINLAQSLKEFDLILYGATGCVGGIAAKHYAYQPGLKWAIAGRTEAKLRALAEELGAMEGQVSKPEVIVAKLDGSQDPKPWVQRTRAVISAAGPFNQNGGEVLVKACAELGVHYADTSDEFYWQRWMVDRYHEVAKGTKANIVLGSGFTILAGDLGSQLAMDLLFAPPQGTTTTVRAVLEKYNGGWSSGVLALLSGEDNSTYPKEWATDPYVLAPELPEELRIDKSVTGVGKLGNFPGMGTVTGDIFGEYNARLLRRSFAQLGQNVHLRDGAKLSTYSKWSGFLLARLGSWKVKESCPSEKIRREGSWAMSFRAERSDDFAQIKLQGKGDPGYVLTPLGLAEVGLCLAGITVGCVNSNTAGVLTPASALHIPILKERLQTAGLLETKIVKRAPLNAMNRKIDVQRFMGCWFVHANIPTFADKDSVNNLEHYVWDPKKKHIKVTFQYEKKGKTKNLKQHAKVANEEGTEWRLSVKLGVYLPLNLPYILLYVADDYSSTIVGYPDRSYVWLMTRSTSISESEMEALFEKATYFGYDRDKIIRVPRTPDAVVPDFCDSPASL